MSSVSIVVTTTMLGSNILDPCLIFFKVDNAINAQLVKKYNMLIHFCPNLQNSTKIAYTFTKDNYKKYIASNKICIPGWKQYIPFAEVTDYIKQNNITVDITEQVDFDISNYIDITLHFS